MSQNTIPKRFRQRIQEAKEQQLEELDLSYDWLAGDSQKLTQIPNEVFELTHLKKLDLSNNNIQHIPLQISRLISLNSLDLIANYKLTDIPQELVQLPSLVSLRLTWNVNTTIPEWFRQIKQLGLHLIEYTEKRYFENIETIPDTIVNLENLVFLKIWLDFHEDWLPWLKTLKELELNLSRNRLTTLPHAITNLSNLTTLYLYNNQLTTLPHTIGNLSNLTTLNLSRNQLTTLPHTIGNLSNLTTLNLSRNRLTTLPHAITDLSNLATLNLSRNQLTTLPHAITNLSNLTALNLSENQLTTLPAAIGNLSNLTALDLSKNQLTTLPESIINLSSLPYLNLKENQLTTLPESIINLSNLTRLNLSRNRLTTLPAAIGSLSNLTTLDLSRNQLTNLPAAIGSLSNLTTLNLTTNRLVDLPESIINLSNLTRLGLSDNPLKIPPLEVAKKGAKAIREYFRQLEEEGKDYIYEAKLLIVGEAGAGKTTLANKILNPDYKLRQDEETTKGIDVIKWSFLTSNKAKKEREFKVNIWDFGGQEIYHTTHQFFLTKRSLYALVADTRKEDTDFYYWLNVVELLSNNSPLLIVKNEKEDRHIEIDIDSLRGRFENLRESLATNLKNNRGLNAILDSLKYHFTQLPHVGSALPKTWKRVREALEQDKRNYISFKEYVEMCQNNDFIRREDKLQLSGYLHDLGVCLHFQDSPLLKNTVILKPEWGTDAVYKVLDDKQVINSLGKFTTKDLDKIWSDEQYTFKQAELLELMMRFKLCYQIPGTQDTYIAPQLLTKTKPNYKWDETDNLILRYTYEFMPKGIITELIVAMHQHIYQQEYVWRSGVLLNKDDTLAEVIEYYDKREIKIRVSGKRKKDLLTIITHELDKIHDSYPRLKYSQLIPCNCSLCHNNQEPYFYKREDLQRFKEHRQLKIQCLNSFQLVNVLGLIDDVILENNQQLLEEERPSQPSSSREVHIHVNQGDRTTNQSRNLSISGNAQVDASGAGALSLGDISGTVANTINQLPTFDNEPNKQELKELLTQLQTAVNETDLEEEDKQETLEQINSIAQALLDNQNRKLKRKAKGAIAIIQDIATALPSDTPMVTIFNQLFDAIEQLS